MKKLVQKFSNPGDLLLEAFEGTLSAAEALLMLEKHRRFLRCQKDCGFRGKSEALQSSVNAFQLGKDKSN